MSIIIIIIIISENSRKRMGQLLGDSTFHLKVNVTPMLMVIFVVFRDKKSL